MTYQIIACPVVVFESPDGAFPAPELMGTAVAKAVNDALLSVASGGWSVMYTPPASPVKRWRVVFGPAALRGAPATSAPRLGTAQTGDVLTEIETRPDWVHTDRGWLLAKQVEPA